MAASNAQRQAAWRADNLAVARTRQRASMAKLRAVKPDRVRFLSIPKRFIALDGEGGGTDESNRQNYQLLRAGDATGHFARSITAQPRLTTPEMLDFILDLPKDAILVGYFFGYDVTMILRDMPFARWADMFGDKTFRKNRYTYWREYGIEYLPKQYFRVCRINRETLKVIPGTSRTVNEVGGFFQQTFVEALRNWEVGSPAMLDMIASQKDRRNKFGIIGDTENDYCKAECKLAAQLMEKLREVCIEAKIVPREWRGAGHIAARLHELHETPKRKTRQRWKIIDKLAQDAYYGGRFEITTIGRIPGDVWEYDIRSAYPAAMLELLCPIHGKWKRFRGAPSPDTGSIYIADISFQHAHRAFLCGFPIRQAGRLHFPRMGSGIYWSPEIEAASIAGAEISFVGGYQYLKKCDCYPFQWVNDLFEFRKTIGSKTKGMPIKLGLNGLYGKFAQRLGGAPYRDYVLAGLMTAITRAKIIRAYATVKNPRDILYIATDAIYSRSPLDIDIGAGLGQWEATKRDGMFIVQPGIYWSGDALPKTRGIPRSVIIEHRTEFIAAWDQWLCELEDDPATPPPIVPVFVDQFIGMRAALARGKPELAGTWLSDLRATQPDIGVRQIKFKWNKKRAKYGDHIGDGYMVTYPKKGHPHLRSEGYDGDMLTEFNAQLIEREDDPDFVHWGNSGE